MSLGQRAERDTSNDLGPLAYSAMILALSMALSLAMASAWDVTFWQAFAAIWTIRFLAMTGR